MIALGALSNVALAIEKEPKFKDLVKRIVFMGGGVVKAKSNVPSQFERNKKYICHGCHNMR